MAERGRPTEREVLTISGMIQEQEESKKSRLYKAQNLEISEKEIQKSVYVALDEMHNLSTGQRIRLEDTETVKELTEQYLLACAKTATMPRMSGLAHSLGYSRSGLSWFMRNKPNHATTEFLQCFRDICSDILSQNSLMGSVHPIVAIFLQKALYGLRDTASVEIVPQENGLQEMTHDELVKQYGHLLEQEE